MLRQTNEFVAAAGRSPWVGVGVGFYRGSRAGSLKDGFFPAFGAVFLASCILLVGCGDREAADGGRATDAVRAYVAAYPAGEKALETVVDGSPAALDLEVSRPRLTEVGAAFELIETRIEAMGPESATIAFELEVRGDPGFRGYRMKGTCELRREKRRWRVFATDLISLEYPAAPNVQSELSKK